MFCHKTVQRPSDRLQGEALLQVSSRVYKFDYVNVRRKQVSDMGLQTERRHSCKS